MDKNEFRVLIKHCYLMGKNTVQAQQWLEKCYPDCALSKTAICRWYADFKRGRTDTNDAERSGRPNEAVTPENIKQVDDSESCLSLFTRNKQDFLRRYVTMDETWIYHFTPESKRQSAECRAAGESRSKRPKMQQSAGKVMASVFSDAHGIIYIDYLEKGKYINSDYYIELLVRLKDEIAKKRTHMKKKKIIKWNIFPKKKSTCIFFKFFSLFILSRSYVNFSTVVNFYAFIIIFCNIIYFFFCVPQFADNIKFKFSIKVYILKSSSKNITYFRKIFL